jgi:hypothetical protein
VDRQYEEFPFSIRPVPSRFINPSKDLLAFRPQLLALTVNSTSLKPPAKANLNCQICICAIFFRQSVATVACNLFTIASAESEGFDPIQSRFEGVKEQTWLG